MKLDTPILRLPSVGSVYANRLRKLDIETAEDLLLHVPSRYIDYRIKSAISDTQPGETVTIQGKIESVKNIYTTHGKKIQMGEVSDKTGVLTVVWFNQPYLIRNVKKGMNYSFSGKIDWFDRKKALVSPEYEPLDGKTQTLHTGRLVPVYPETARVSSKWLRGKVVLTLSLVEQWLDDFVPTDVLARYSLIDFIKALESVHFPETPEEAREAKTRLAFNELLFHHLRSLMRKKDWHQIMTANRLIVDTDAMKEFINSLAFDLTNSQIRSINEISEDLVKDSPMNRLLEGDVGSGKTVVAAAAAFASFINGYQTVFMAPTQILANQHFNTLHEIFDRFKVRVSLVTSSLVKKDLGKTDIFVGTHALIHKKIDFESVSLVVIDEQHRFGVEQRAHLIKKTENKGTAPHILTMTATPIPRTAALTIYGDLDLSTLDELPKGRRPITTWVISPAKRDSGYEWIKDKIKKENIQVYIICPLIEESEVETMRQVKAATVEYEKLKEIFSDMNVDLLHGRQSAKLKNEVLDSFKKGVTKVLVSTPVVEVGIDVANATIMVIEGAERFGLAQLHQLRGRVGRGSIKSYCLLITDSHSNVVFTRLKALTKSMSGFELAELDLKMRGPGEIFGKKQHGFLDLKIAAWSDTDLIKKSRSVAEEAIENPKKFSKLLNKIDSQNIVPN
ncbi:ATP-dependent DNA helicase RecG [Candidatus Woesebacteria bacterium RIFCSPLOWO2_01_FULL_39_61]|uniref:ATP-dependent DNA helicase RecG n=1 Tax=Candidatus Woesebacteria bacterium RIFCSPHIGHO2_02_FULL_39_13 TaxID=1802505 RepID=A0A1F7Z446_9BACT|nr:MAG: ATP-dependent DNA helicase RecG [Candidatus Woesebacteria bacterium RIFCSPHIGHO2_01_FULL_39_95]OGM34297.1 MAG: ATP-dependent DNA helicase RecG [Candidatus Woesebacteria bacterium RIFCSPHIGHO2_02_FULL_39_13]OGM39079.1 MAG: ATP-dependent DNA helicase RecG [Candidatus Woesebacteria bacterium RIFCSPHIGHO2_12_FULL_40_20]OGM68634.1 MAG: ATP-dependent DNA helicase RecG [Candidatus Woesebacteria bacterium RIFCSPLOWO2_01_FULL_39_61]OGM73989.1 MAG: ATP-dependent DNA helicase RecG [Candidatus Woes